MTIVQQGFDLDEFFSEHEMTEEIAESVTEIRAHLQEYVSAKSLESEAARRKAEAKKAIEQLFGELPDDYKETVAQTPKTVAGQVFARVKKVITLDGWNLIFNEKVNTKSPRDKFLKELDSAAAGASTVPEREAYQNAKRLFESHLDPTLGNEFKIEPVSERS